MEIIVRGKNTDVSAKLRSITQEKLAKVERLVHDVSRVEVDFAEVRNPRVADKAVCEVTLHLKRHFVKAHAAAPEPMAALDLVVDKVEHQVARVKEKRVGRSHPRRRRLQNHAPPLEDDFEEDGEDEALVVRTKRFTLKPMGVEEATLQMDLLGHSFYLFTNADNGHAAVVYRRRDGHLGLIEATG